MEVVMDDFMEWVQNELKLFNDYTVDSTVIDDQLSIEDITRIKDRRAIFIKYFEDVSKYLFENFSLEDRELFLEELTLLNDRFPISPLSNDESEWIYPNDGTCDMSYHKRYIPLVRHKKDNGEYEYMDTCRVKCIRMQDVEAGRKIRYVKNMFVNRIINTEYAPIKFPYYPRLPENEYQVLILDFHYDDKDYLKIFSVKDGDDTISFKRYYADSLEISQEMFTTAYMAYLQSEKENQNE